jgi:8-oxo-dGTP pyrophosphatase MutT (NUDIX family)
MANESHGAAAAPNTSANDHAAVATYIEQAGAICCRVSKGRAEILLIRGRRNGKWGIPKGGIEAGETSSQAAAREAFEEAGVSGLCEETALDTFRYQKQGKSLPCRVAVHRMQVENTATEFPEASERTACWITWEDAINLVEHEGLRRILRTLAP